jgi:ketosteroid isomerase-like protein
MTERTAADVELLESVLAQWGRGEFWDAEPYAEDVVFVVSGPEGGEYRGLDGLGFAWRNFLSAWEDFRMEDGRVMPGREGMYAILMRNIGRGQGSGMVIEADVANVVTMRAGRITRLEMYWDREAALRAAGVPEDDA